ncbi:MAG TPA: LuxR C-terminal-related transcriptional regulator [Streptosporangiaceae bacterium]|jgi:DNA-binding CsgD family transcriptional regulator|nr:LuxR C-terminal-related transcriptional regulator [Streptosporangiaceae bacterium]
MDPVSCVPRQQEHALGLTRRERDVLDLICAGHTNGEIAGKLFIPVKTVGHHVSAVLAKLDAPTRGAAATQATKLGLAGAVHLECRSRNSRGRARFKIIGRNALFPLRVLTEVPSSGQPGGRGRRFGHAAAGPQSDRNRQDVGTTTETRPTPMARRPAVRYGRPVWASGPLPRTGAECQIGINAIEDARYAPNGGSAR